MSQSSGHSEEELAGYIYKCVGLKLDKNWLVKPTRDGIIEIFSRFLDQMHPCWEKCESGRETSRIVQLFRWMKQIFERFNIKPEFNFYDLSAPTRKRTYELLTVLLIFKAKFDVREEQIEFQKKVNEERQARIEELKQELALARDKREQLAFEKVKLVDVQSLPEALEAQAKKTNERKQECELLDKKKYEYKDRIKEAQQQSQELQAKRIQSCKLIAAREASAKAWKDRKRLEEENLKLRRTRDDQKLSNQVDLMQIKTDLNGVRAKRDEIKRRYNSEMASKREKMSQIAREKSALEDEEAGQEEKFNAFIGRSNKRLEEIKSRFESSKKLSEQSKIDLEKNCHKINKLLFNDEVKQASINNATYIK